MSLSKSAINCEICLKESGIYSCPRCNRRYCSSACYKRPEHAQCSESFYREWVEKSLQNESFDRSEKETMLDILKRTSYVCDDNECATELSIEDRFANLDINATDESVLWENLSSEEKNAFKSLVKDEKNIESIIHLKQPWWVVTMLNLVTELDTEKPDENDDVSPRPLYPLNIKKLSDLSSKEPSESVQYNLVNVLYAYGFLYRFYNCELRDFLEEVVDELFKFSPALLEQNYFSLEECIQDSIRLISNCHADVPLDFVKSIVNDVCSIMKGPSNAKCSTFVLCSLHDLKLLFLELKFAYKQHDKMDKNSKRYLNLAIKKIEYLMSWCVANEIKLPDIASDLLLLMLPDMVSESEKSRNETLIKNEVIKSRPLIQEID